MRIRKKGSALISTVIVLSVMSLIGSMYYKMTEYNIKLQALAYNHNDRYDLSREENDAVYEFMNEINNQMKDSGEEISAEVLKSRNWDLSIGINGMRYNPETDKFILRYYEKDNTKKHKELKYKIDNNKIILVPSHVIVRGDINFIENWKE